MLDADAVINNSSQKVGGSNAYPDSAPKKVGGSGPRKTHRIYATDDNKPAPAEAVMHWILLANSTGFLPSDAVLVRHMLSSCVHLFVRPSVCHKPVFYRNDWTNRAGFWHAGFLPSIPHCVIKKCGYLQKLRYFPLALCPNSGLRKFRHSKSIVLSTKLVVVDGRACWRHLYDSRHWTWTELK